MRSGTSRTGAAALLAAVLASHGAAQEAAPPADRPWTVVYVMSYDNDLERHGTTILGALRNGLRDTPNAAAVLADDRDPGGLRRFVLTGEGTTASRIDSDDSTSAAVLGEFLEWVAAEVPARRYVIAFLDHGGGQGEMCQDWRPAEDTAAGWMHAREAAKAVTRFHDGGRRDVALLFLQQCGRANAADLWTFRAAAPWILASQTRVGAPNTYYESVLGWLADHPDASGADVARRIAAEDRHFSSLALVDAAAARELPERLKPLAEALLRRDTPSAPAGLPACYGGTKLVQDTSFDLVQWTAAAAAGDAAAEAAAASLRGWVESKLVAEHLRGPVHEEGSGRWCGVSLFVPSAAAARRLHADHPFDRESGLAEVWKRLFGE